MRIVHAADEHDEADVVVNWIKETFETLPRRGAGATSPSCTGSIAIAI